VSRDPFFGVSDSKDFGLGLELFVSRLCIGYLLWSFARSFLKNGLKNDCSKFSRSKRSVAKLSLLLCYLRDGDNNLPYTPFKIYPEFNKKCACTNETAAHNLCNKRLGVGYFAKDYLWTVFPGVCYEIHRLIQKRWESSTKFLFWEAKWNHVFFSKCFSKYPLKTCWWIFFIQRNADFKLKNASELSWGKVLLIRLLCREQIMRHGWSVTLTYCYGFTAFLRFLTDMRCCENS